MQKARTIWMRAQICKTSCGPRLSMGTLSLLRLSNIFPGQSAWVNTAE